MFISRKFYEALVAAQTEARILSEQNRILATNLDNARLRLNQLEKERAQLMYAVAGAKISAPEFVQTSPDASMWGGGPMNLADMPSIEDIGDDAAKALGIGWDKEGKLTYGMPNDAMKGGE